MKKIVAVLLILLLSVGAVAEYTATVDVGKSGGTLHLRSATATSSPSLGIVRQGDNVIIQYESGEWSYIYVPRLDKTGFLKTKYLKNIISVKEDDGLKESGSCPSYDVIAVSSDPKRYSLPAQFSVDMDGDGTAESVFAEYVPKDGYDDQVVISVFDNGKYSDPVYTDIIVAADAHFVRLDNSGRVYMLLDGDVMSSDFITYCFCWDGDSLKTVPFNGKPVGGGAVATVENGVLTLVDVCDIFGTYGAQMDYTLSENGFSPVPGTLWRISINLADESLWNEFSLRVKRDLPAVVFGKKGTVKAGTKLFINAVDYDNARAYFVTDRAVTGYFEYTASANGWGHSVGGYAEDSCFDNIRYAG